MKGAHTVLRRGKPERAYLFRFGRALYYGSYQNPRTLVWSIGVVIFILMILTAFMGYKHSPKSNYIKVRVILWFLIIPRLRRGGVNIAKKIKNTLTLYVRCWDSWYRIFGELCVRFANSIGGKTEIYKYTINTTNNINLTFIVGCRTNLCLLSTQRGAAWVRREVIRDKNIYSQGKSRNYSTATCNKHELLFKRLDITNLDYPRHLVGGKPRRLHQ